MAVNGTLETHLAPSVSLWKLFGSEETSTNLQVKVVRKFLIRKSERDRLTYHGSGKCNEHEAQDHRKELHDCSCIEGCMFIQRQELVGVGSGGSQGEEEYVEGRGSGPRGKRRGVIIGK